MESYNVNGIIDDDKFGDDIDPLLKDDAWILHNVKKRWSESLRYTPGDMFWNGRARYEEIIRYCMGKQTVDKYKRRLLPEDQQDESWMNIDWNVRPIMTTYLEKATSKILQRDFNIVCTAVNEIAKTDQDEYYNKMRVKLAMREALRKSNPELLDNPAVKINAGEPESVEELNMYMDYGYKHTMSLQAEMGIDLVFGWNDIQRLRKFVVESLVRFGLGGYKDYIDASGRVVGKAVVVSNLMTSYCEQSDFSDATHIGEVVEKTFGEISKYFSKAQLEEIKKLAAGNYGNPPYSDTRWQQQFNKFKVRVWEVEFLSYNTTIWEERTNKKGNKVFGKTDYNVDPDTKKRNAEAKGEEAPNYMRSTKEVLYKSCWIVDTDYQYEAGLATNMKRTNSNPWKANSSYHLLAWNFDKMTFAGLAERLIPWQDEYQMTVYKIENFKLKWIPYILKIDIGALEKTAIKGKGGQNMNPMQLLDFLSQQHILLLRDDSLNGTNPNYKAFELQMTQMAEEFKVLFEDLVRIVGEMEKIAGFNTISAGGTPDPRTLAPGYNAALAGTMDSLFLVTESERRLLERFATGIVQRMQVAIKLGKIEGYVNSLGKSAVKFFSLSPDISLYDFGIFAEDRPDAAAREEFKQMFKLDFQNGLILPQDLILIENCKNLKQAEIQLAFRIDKRKKENQQMQLQAQQMQQQGTIQNQQMAAQQKQAELAMQLEADIQRINAEKKWDYIIQQIKVQGSQEEAKIHAQAKMIAQQMIEDSKQKLAG